MVEPAIETAPDRMIRRRFSQNGGPRGFQHSEYVIVTPKEEADSVSGLDEDGFIELFRRHYPELLRYASRLLNNHPACPDFVQEAFLRLWKRRLVVESDGSVRALLFLSVRNLAFNHLRDAERNASIPIDASQASSTADPEALASESLIRARFDSWIAQLPPRQREAFELSRHSGLRYEEIAAVMGVTPKTVENHILLALKFLRNKVKEFDPTLLIP